MRKPLLRYSLSALLVCGLLYSSPIFAENQADHTAYNTVMTQPKGFEVIKTTINKSPTDKAIYQAIKLANGMEVLLVSDEKANQSLLSVGLPIGSMDNPIQQQGLAHYLEHMILMGSKNFPETNSLDNFLTKNGGYNNAYTAPDRTVYYLEVKHSAFDEAVTRFADTMAQPLLSEKNAKKEIDAVNAEMVRAKSSDGVLVRDVALATANPAHPITKFAVGNHTTLSDKKGSKLQDELVKFYQQYYSANIMKAVLYSNQPIEKLAKLAEKTLGLVENKHIIPPKVDIPFLREDDKSVIIHYKPIKPNKTLSLSFDMPEDKAAFQSKTGEYLSYVFENNTEGTLSDYLIKQGLSDSGISANYEPDITRNRGSFSFNIALTDKGLAEKDKIISLVFQQIEAIKKAGIQPSYFNELKESLSQEFQHLEIVKGGGYVAGLVNQMIDYPLAHIIDQSYIADKMDENAIKAKLDLMNVDNVRILLIDDKAKTDKKTQYFEAPYAIAKLTAAQKAKYLDFSQNPTLKLPALNPYFATDFSLNPVDRSRIKPAQIVQQQGLEIYAMPSHYFAEEPKAKIALNFMISPEKDDLKQAVSAELLGYMYDLDQSQLDFQAAVAGMDIGWSGNHNALTLQVEGYTQHLAKLVKDVVSSFSRFELKQSVLAQGKQRYLEGLDRLAKDNALRQANRAISDFADYPYYSVEQQRKMVEQIQLADIEQIRTRFLTQMTGARVLSVGNLSDQQVKAITADMSSVIKNNQSALNTGRYVDINDSERKLNYIQSIPHEDNGLSIAFFAKGYGELEGLSRAMLLKDIIGRWYFDDLRTDKQLGYVVSATDALIGKTSGLLFLVQSPTASPQQIMQHNQRFFADTLAKLQKMSESEFEKYRASLLEILRHKPESLSREFIRFNTDFIRGNTQFDLKARIIAQVEQLNKQDLIDFYRNAVIDQKGLVFASQAIGSNSKINQVAELKGFEKITNIEQLQKEFDIKRF